MAALLTGCMSRRREVRPEAAGGEACARGVEGDKRAEGAAVFGTTGEGWVSQRV